MLLSSDQSSIAGSIGYLDSAVLMRARTSVGYCLSFEPRAGDALLGHVLCRQQADETVSGWEAAE